MPESEHVAAVETHAAEHGHAVEHGHGGVHGFNFDALNLSHNYPYPAIEWVHGHPALILNAPAYAKHNFAILSQDPNFAAKSARPEYELWAKELSGGAEYSGIPTGQLAKAMTVAADQAWLGAMPKALSFFTHQTFWSTIALLLLSAFLLIFARRKPEQHKPEGRIQNVLETLVLFVRDEIVRPNIKHGANAWTPFFASLFLAILACNLFGLIPIFGTATGTIGVTVAWAGVIALMILALGMKENGPLGFWASIVPVHWEWKPGPMALWLFLFPLELLSLVSRPVILAIRLFANMFAGHIVLLVFVSLGFIVFASDPSQSGMALGTGVFGWVLTVAIYSLELLVSVLQAFIFTLLSAAFIGMYMHPEH